MCLDYIMLQQNILLGLLMRKLVGHGKGHYFIKPQSILLVFLQKLKGQLSQSLILHLILKQIDKNLLSFQLDKAYKKFPKLALGCLSFNIVLSFYLNNCWLNNKECFNSLKEVWN